MSDKAIFINERDAPLVSEQPIVAVNSWRVIEALNGDQHLLIILESGSLRTTSAISNFDRVATELTTRSGRRYVLLGPPEARRAKLDLLFANAVRVGIAAFIDISDELWRSVSMH